MTLTLRILEIAFGGSGVAKHEGKVVFVPFTIDEELVEVEVIESHKSYNLALPRVILQPSPYRETPPCPYYQACGGCDYQHIQYAHQLELKRLQVEQVLTRIANLRAVAVPPIVPSPRSFGFRNRITIHSDGRAVGFFRKKSRQIVDIARCALASETVNAKLGRARNRGLPAGSHTTLREDESVTTFTQTNNAIAQEILSFVQARAKGSVLVDAYCGSGFFAHQLAPQFKTVIGIERHRVACDSAARSALPNEEYLCAEVGEILGQVLQKLRVDVLIVDPPAEGLAREVSLAISEYPPRKIIYISCNPATFARDLTRLPFRLVEVQPFDMFPQTAEIELVAVLEPAYTMFSRLSDVYTSSDPPFP
jgi:tRNA/tmRNA/rRNA uracil-C5-methylase (TrmA/RlmC/RlmD family)